MIRRSLSLETMSRPVSTCAGLLWSSLPGKGPEVRLSRRREVRGWDPRASKEQVRRESAADCIEGVSSCQPFFRSMLVCQSYWLTLAASCYVGPPSEPPAWASLHDDDLLKNVPARASPPQKSREIDSKSIHGCISTDWHHNKVISQPGPRRDALVEPQFVIEIPRTASLPGHGKVFRPH